MKIKINPGDIRLRFYKSSGPGGQKKNKTMSAVEAVHVPTGLKANSSRQRSQPQNVKAAIKVLLSRIYAYFHVQEERFKAPTERVRTYHEPDNRVTDHASGFQQSYREVVTKGDISRMIEARAKTLLGGK